MGTALAAIVSSKLGARIAVQEQAVTVNHTVQCLHMNSLKHYCVLQGQWTELESMHNSLQSTFGVKQCHRIIMADILFREEDFDNLICLILSILQDGGSLIWCHEVVSHRDLSMLVDKFTVRFTKRKETKYTIEHIQNCNQEICLVLFEFSNKF